MRWIRAAAAALIAIFVVSGAGAAAPASGAPVSYLSGVIRDDLGKAIEGVEVLVLAPEGHGNDTLLRALSDGSGRFLVSLHPGVYRVAAIKSGYVAALGRVNTVLRSSVDLVLRPVPQPGERGAEKVQDDMSWTLRVPPRGILREIEAKPAAPLQTASATRAFMERVQDAMRGEVDQVFAFGTARAGSSEASNLSGNETRMRLAGSLGERGAIQVRGRRGSLDSTAPPGPGTTAVSRGRSDVDFDMSYDTGADENLAMRAFYSSGDLSVDAQSVGSPESRQSQRSFGYDAEWKKQVDASSHVAVQVGFHDANLGMGQTAVPGWEPPAADAWNRAIGAMGTYENLVTETHLVRVAVQAQRSSLEAPDMRANRDIGSTTLDGPTGWNLLVDTEDQWSVSSPVALAYGLAVRRGFTDQDTALTPRVGAAITLGRTEGRVAVSYDAGLRDEELAASAGGYRSPIGYEAEWKARLHPTTTLAGTAAYVPSRADVGDQRGRLAWFDSLYISDGFSSDHFVALDLEHVTPAVSVGFRVARGRAEGALSPVIDESPVVVLSDRTLDYGAARISVKALRVGSAVSLGYQATRDRGVAGELDADDALRTLDLQFIQDIVRFAGGRASCRFLMTARTALRPGSESAEAPDALRALAEDRRIGAGVSLAF